MIEKGILAIIIIMTVNAVLLVSGFVGNVENTRPTIPGLPLGLVPTEFNSNDTDLDFVETNIATNKTDLLSSAVAGVTGLIFNIPFIGDLFKAISSIAAIFFDFMFFWAIALNASGLPPVLIYLISVPLAFFQYGVLVFFAFSILQSLVTARR